MHKVDDLPKVIGGNIGTSMSSSDVTFWCVVYRIICELNCCTGRALATKVPLRLWAFPWCLRDMNLADANIFGSGEPTGAVAEVNSLVR